MDFRETIKILLPQSKLSPIETNISADYHLRFELGAGYENGTIERVNQSTKRGLTIFNELFNSKDQILVMFETIKHVGDIKTLWEETPLYFEEQFEHYEDIEKQIFSEYVEEFDEALHEDGVMRMTNFSANYYLTILKTTTGEINIENISRGIANSEMGFTPKISRRLWFINLKNELAFNMYDDRGCIVFSEKKDELTHMYIKYSTWLDDYYRETFDRLFADA